MRIKTKLTLGVGLLFFLIILLGTVGARYSAALKQDTDNILSDNYNTLLYLRNMLEALQQNKAEVFEHNLQKQETNITESGEQALTQNLRRHFEELQRLPNDSSISAAIHQDILLLMAMNMQAIENKSEVAKDTADNAVSWIALTGTLCFLIAFLLLVNLPANIANPIQELSESIKQIAAQNYSKRVAFESHSEFGELAKSFNTMAQKLEEYKDSNLAQLLVEKKRIETLIDKMHDPIIGLDQDLRIVFINQEAIKIININKKELIGHFIQQLADKNDLIKSLTKELLIGWEQQNNTKPLKIFNNQREEYFEKEILHITLTATGELKPKLAGHFIILRNITQHKELDFAKTNFIATISHELKTPVSSIKMSLQLLENKKVGLLNTEQQNLISSIQDDANRLLKIIGELLNMTQVESGNIQLAILPSDPKEILQYAINATKIQAEQKQIHFTIDCPEVVSKVQADSEKTAWVLTNLIANAVRYSYDNATIFLCITESTDKVFFAVKDTGQGIAPEYKDKIFDRYFRVPGTQKEGTGLGLAISKEFMEAQGGYITVKSEFGAGSTFTLSCLKTTRFDERP